MRTPLIHPLQNRQRPTPRVSPGGSALRLALWVPLLCATMILRGAEADFPRTLDVAPLRSVVVQHDGRYMPLDTLARDLVSKVTGTPYFAGRDPIVVLLAWTFAGRSWQDAPLIPIHNERLRDAIGLPILQREFSFSDLASHARFNALADEADSRSMEKKADALRQKAGKIRDRLAAFQTVLQGAAIRIVPIPGDAQTAWETTATLLQDTDAATKPARDAWTALGEAYLADDAAAFATAALRLKAALLEIPAAYRPTPALLAKEIRYNRLHAYRIAWMALALAALLAGLALWVRRRWFDGLAALVTLTGFGVFTYGLSLRWAVAGRIPASNMFESLLFLSWGAAAFAFVAFFAFRRQRSVPLTAAAIGALALCLADSLPLDHFVRPVAPVLLDTFWMSVHVPVIMISYAVLAIAVLIAHVQVVAAAVLPPDRPLITALDRYHYGYVMSGSLLLLIGIVTGSMWAASSWGRYWGWDPKEVWSLVALLGYMTIIHVRADRKPPSRLQIGVAALLAPIVFALAASRLEPLSIGKVAAFAVTGLAAIYFIAARSLFATAAKSILAFWLIIMTYVGVNYVLGTGLHSYGFGAGAVAGRMFLIGAIDLAILLVCLLIYSVRNWTRAAPSATR